jgi:2-methylisocitrate lyase-like PEP mutase family enzyme
VEGPASVEEVRRIVGEVRGPVFYNMTGISPRLTTEELGALGVAVAILPGALLRLTIQALYDFAVDLRARGPVVEAALVERLATHALGDLHEFAGFGQIRAWEERYLPREDLDKYRDSLGHQPGRR